jgi:hypothetical protein
VEHDLFDEIKVLFAHDFLLESCCMGRIAPQAQHAMLVEIPENQNDTISMSSSGGATQ